MAEGIIQTFMNSRVTVAIGNITKQQVDAIVNAANSTLLGGGGVDGAIHRAGGKAILEECQQIRQTRYPRGLPTGEVVATTAGLLPAKYVIHTVGPIYGREDSREAELLRACYSNSLLLAAQLGLRSIAFPAISTGAFGYPMAEAAKISSSAIKIFLAEDDSLKEVRLVFISPGDAETYLKHSHKIFGNSLSSTKIKDIDIRINKVEES
jgi:O-acetyl-ADP-ribose deacetylase